MSEATTQTQKELNDNFHHGERARDLFPQNYNEYGQKRKLREKWGFGSHQSFFYNLDQKEWSSATVKRICNAEGLSLSEFYAPTRLSKLQVVGTGNVTGDGNVVSTQAGKGNVMGRDCVEQVEGLKKQIKYLEEIIKQKDSLIDVFQNLINKT